MEYSDNNLPKCGLHFPHVMSKYMMLRKNADAWHCLANLRRTCLDWEPILVYNEDNEYWVGQYCEGLGFFDVRFPKSECRDMTESEYEKYGDGARYEIIGI